MMHYRVSGRAPSFISAGLALLLALGMHLAADRGADTGKNRSAGQVQLADAGAKARPSGAL
jgi:hypothetical protein